MGIVHFACVPQTEYTEHGGALPQGQCHPYPLLLRMACVLASGSLLGSKEHGFVSAPLLGLFLQLGTILVQLGRCCRLH